MHNDVDGDKGRDSESSSGEEEYSEDEEVSFDLSMDKKSKFESVMS